MCFHGLSFRQLSKKCQASSAKKILTAVDDMGQKRKMFAEETLKILRDFVEVQHNGITLHASKALGIPNDTLNRWLKGERDPGLSKIGPVIDKILWNHATPEKIGVLDIKFPEMRSDGSYSKAECEQLQQDLKNANDKIAELERKLIAAEAIANKLEDMMNKKIQTQTPKDIPQKTRFSQC